MILITIDLVYGTLIKTIDSEHNNLFQWLFFRGMLYLVLIYLITHWAPAVANFTRDFYLSMGAEAMNASIDDTKNAISNPFDLIQKGASIITPIVFQMQEINLLDNLLISVITFGLMMLACIIIFGMLSVITFHIVLAYLEFYLTMLFSFVMFVFSGTKQTRQFASKTFNGIFTASAKLFFFCIFSLMLQNVMTDFQCDTLFEQKSIEVASGGENEVFQMLKGLGATDIEIAGIMGNIMQEDGRYDPLLADDTHAHIGLFQLDSKIRWPRFEEWCHQQNPPLSPSSSSAQVVYVVMHENGNLLEEMRASGITNAADMATWWMENIERSGEVPGERGYNNRRTYAEDYLARIHGNTLEGGSSTSTVTKNVTVLNIMLLLNLILIITIFMILGDRIKKTIVKTFGGGGFRFANE